MAVNLASMILPIAMLSVLVAVIVAAAKTRGRQTLLCLLVGVICWPPGCQAGIRFYCTSPDSSPQCGLGGVFGTGPLAFSAGVLVCVFLLRGRKYFDGDSPR